MKKQAILKSLQQQLSLNNDSKVLVVGLGKTGFSVAKFLQKYDIAYAVVDSRESPPFYQQLISIYPDTPLFMGGFDKAAFEVATHIVVSPGVAMQETTIQTALLSGVELVSDIDLFACATNKPVVAITGSNGKSTVTTMVEKMLDIAGMNAKVGGNLGMPALDLIEEDVELYVLELSSFQLERTSKLNATVATVLNISADHLDRHGDLEKYAKAKQGVFSGDGIMLLNFDDALVKSMLQEDRTTLVFSVKEKIGFHLETIDGENWLMNEQQKLMLQSDLPVVGIHNVANALAAFALGNALNLNNQLICQALRNFRGLAHRMQKVAQIKGVTWVNDSKATNIGACLAALSGFQQKVVLIAGGDSKGADMHGLVTTINEKAKCIVLLGKDAEVIESAINGFIPCYRAESVQEAVNIASNLAKDGESVLLSPACASTDQFLNYQERGDKFTAAVMELAA